MAKTESETRELLVDEDEVRDAYGDDPAGTVVRLADSVESLRLQVQRLTMTVNDLYSVLREVAPDRLSRYELKQQIQQYLTQREEERK